MRFGAGFGFGFFSGGKRKTVAGVKRRECSA
jgi:hypothetical protein